jgi:multiple sugar transport system substrate-binding protein
MQALKPILAFLLTTAMLLALGACGGGEGGGEELVFRQFDPPGEVEGLQEAVDQWNAENETQVRLENMSSEDVVNQYTREVQTGTGADIQHLPFVGINQLAENELLVDLSPYIEDSPPGEGFDDFLATELATFEDKPYALPWTTDTFAMAYRPDLLEEAGITEFPDTWQDFQSAAQRLSSGGWPGFCFTAGSGQGGGMWFLANYYLWSNGIFLIDDTGGGNYEVAVTQAELADAMEYFNAFFQSGATPESMLGIDSWGDPTYVGALGREDCSITFTPPQSFREAQDQSEAPLMTAPDPRGSEQRISHLGGRALGINPNSENPEAAWEFIKHLNSAEVFEQYNQYPTQRSLLDQIEFPEEEQGFIEMLPRAITFERYLSSPASVPGMQGATNEQFAAVYSGQKTPEQASEDLIRAIEDLLRG